MTRGARWAILLTSLLSILSLFIAVSFYVTYTLLSAVEVLPFLDLIWYGIGMYVFQFHTFKLIKMVHQKLTNEDL